MKIIFRVLILLFLGVTQISLAQQVSIGERFSLTSKVLNEERAYQIYLPPSYYANPKAKFPVFYLLDGDYNFHYDTGLVEFLSNTAFTIPEMIVVGISDKGGTKQLQNSNPAENADDFIKFISTELKPLIKSKYRTEALDILAGHSKFGLLVTHYWMTQATDFDLFLAIDPSYWFNDNEITTRLETKLKSGFSPSSQLYIAQAKTQGMGIDELVDVLEKHLPNRKTWHLEQYLNDNHGSLHMKAISDMLTSTFKGWDLNRELFYSFKSSDEVINHYKAISDKYNAEFLLPWYSLGNVVYYYFRKDEKENLDALEAGIKNFFPNSLEGYYLELAKNHLEANQLDKAKILYETCLESNTKLYQALEGLSKIYCEQKQRKKALNTMNSALNLAKELKLRQWQLNQIQASYNEVLKSSGE